MMYTLQHSLLG